MKRRRTGDVLCSIVGLLYSYGIAGRVESGVLIDKDSILAACKKLSISLNGCIKGWEALRNELILEKVLVVEFPGRIIVESDPGRLAKRLSAYISELAEAGRGAQRESKLRKVDETLSIWRRVKWYYVADEGRLLEYWFRRGLECGASLTIQTPRHACLAIAGLLAKDDIPWNTFQRLAANLLYFGLEECYTLHVGYTVDNDVVDVLLVRRQQCISYPYELIVIEAKSRSKQKLLARGGERDPIAQLERYVKKVAEAYPGSKSILGLLVTNGFAARQLLTDFISEAQRFRDEASRRGLNVRLDIIDFLILYEILEECSKSGYMALPAAILHELLRRKIPIAKKLLEDYEPPRNTENAIEMYERYRERVEKHVKEAMRLR